MKRGVGKLTEVNEQTKQIIRFAGFVMPVVLFLYGVLIQLGLVENEHRIVLPVFYATGLCWIALSIYQFMSLTKTRTKSALILAIYHVLAVVYVLFVSGVDMPFIGTWSVLFLASYAYFGRRALIASITLLFVAALGDAAQNWGDVEYLTRAGLYVLGTLIVGYVAGTITSSTEVDRRELSRSQAEEVRQRDRLLTIVNNLADAVLSTDDSGIIQIYNAATLNLLDTNEELTGRHIDTVMHLIDKDNKAVRLERAFKTARSVENREDLSATISGETIHLSVIFSPIRGTNSHADERGSGFIIILRDITKQKSLEEERDEFISVVSHELRTPITIAEGSLSNVQLMMSRPDIKQATLAENVKVSHDQVIFLAKMVNDLSTLSRAERGIGDATEQIDVSGLIHDLYNEYAPQAEAKGLRFNLDLDPQLGAVVTSRLYLKELLQNFVTNAIKYTKKGEIVVSVKKTAKTLQFDVHDSGIGISKSDQQHIYERFWRSEDYRTRETGGTGLGLYVATKLAKKLGTHIELSSRLNHGSTFGFSLPHDHDDA